MIRRVAIFFIPALTAVFPFEAALAESLLKSREPHVLPAYQAAAGQSDVALYTNESEYEAARQDPDLAFEKLVYKSDGLGVVAYLMSAADKRPRPTVVFNRGSYVRTNAAPEIFPLMHRLAAAGFTVLAPMYRGSEGAPGRDEMGGADLADVMATAALASEIAEIDAGALYLYGESRGGMMVYQALREGYPARAAAVYGGFTDLGRLIESDPERYGGMVAAIWPDFAENREAIVERRSALRFTDKLKAPLLVMHGGRDGDIPLDQALDLAAALAEDEADFKLVVFGREGHILSGRAGERDNLAARWFAAH